MLIIGVYNGGCPQADQEGRLELGARALAVTYLGISVGDGGHVGLDLSEDVGGVLRVLLLNLLLGELGDLAGHHALLVFEKAVRASKEAVEGNYLLEEVKLRALGVLGFLLQVGLGLGVDLGGGLVRGHGLLDKSGNLLNVSLSVNLDGLRGQGKGNDALGNLGQGSGILVISLHFSSR